MARCARCNKFMLLKSQTGYCDDCRNAILEEKNRREQEEHQQKAEKERLCREAEKRLQNLRGEEQEKRLRWEKANYQRVMEELRLRKESEELRLRKESEELRLRKESEELHRRKYDEAIKYMESAVIESTEGIYKIEWAIRLFTDLKDYQDSKQKLTECLHKRASIIESRNKKAGNIRKEKREIETVKPRAEELSKQPQQQAQIHFKEQFKSGTYQTIENTSTERLVFSYSNWDIALGHLPFLYAINQALSEHDGEEVISLGNQLMLKSMNPMVSLDSFCVKHDGDRDYTVLQIQNSKELITEIVAARRKLLLSIPYSFWTPAIVHMDDRFGFAMVSLSDAEQWTFTMQSPITIPSLEAMQFIASLMRIEGRIFADGILDVDENALVFLLSINQMERLANVALSPQTNSSRVHIDVESAKKYFDQLFGYTDEDEYHALESKYEQECSIFISLFEVDKLIPK